MMHDAGLDIDVDFDQSTLEVGAPQLNHSNLPATFEERVAHYLLGPPTQGILPSGLHITEAAIVSDIVAFFRAANGPQAQPPNVHGVRWRFVYVGKRITLNRRT